MKNTFFNNVYTRFLKSKLGSSDSQRTGNMMIKLFVVLSFFLIVGIAVLVSKFTSDAVTNVTTLGLFLIYAYSIVGINFAKDK